MKYSRQMPEDEPRKSFPLVSEGEHQFTITDIQSESEEEITAKCEVVSDKDQGLSLLYRVTINPDSQFFWRTKLFLKCINQAHSGDIVIDTDAWIGKIFTAEVKHSADGKYSNIKKLIYKEIIENPDNVTSPEQIKW